MVCAEDPNLVLLPFSSSSSSSPFLESLPCSQLPCHVLESQQTDWVRIPSHTHIILSTSGGSDMQEGFFWVAELTDSDFQLPEPLAIVTLRYNLVYSTKPLSISVPALLALKPPSPGQPRKAKDPIHLHNKNNSINISITQFPTHALLHLADPTAFPFPAPPLLPGPKPDQPLRPNQIPLAIQIRHIHVQRALAHRVQ
jgi:hypothetical protein